MGEATCHRVFRCPPKWQGYAAFGASCVTSRSVDSSAHATRGSLQRAILCRLGAEVAPLRWSPAATRETTKARGIPRVSQSSYCVSVRSASVRSASDVGRTGVAAHVTSRATAPIMPHHCHRDENQSSTRAHKRNARRSRRHARHCAALATARCCMGCCIRANGSPCGACS